MVRKISVLFLVVALSLSIIVPGVQAQGPPEGIPDPGPPPKGVSLKVFVHPEKGEGGPAKRAMASIYGEGSSAFSYDGIHWADPNGTDDQGILYLVNLNFSTKNSPNLTQEAVRTAINESFNAWVKNLDGTPYTLLLYRNAGPTTAKAPLYDGKNVVCWKNLGAPYIAHAISGISQTPRRCWSLTSC